MGKYEGKLSLNDIREQVEGFDFGCWGLLSDIARSYISDDQHKKILYDITMHELSNDTLDNLVKFQRENVDRLKDNPVLDALINLCIKIYQKVETMCSSLNTIFTRMGVKNPGALYSHLDECAEEVAELYDGYNKFLEEYPVEEHLEDYVLAGCTVSRGSVYSKPVDLDSIVLRFPTFLQAAQEKYLGLTEHDANDRHGYFWKYHKLSDEQILQLHDLYEDKPELFGKDYAEAYERITSQKN